MSIIQFKDQLNINKTFEDQRDLVKKTIIPIIISALDKETFPVINSIIYKIIHQCHRYQREEFLKKQKSQIDIENDKRRRHDNSRRSEVNKKNE
jgi:hypothetical protein